ncbi:MAG: hypothetical protein Q8O88_04250 [bacterium]|nr:hypothetical protein [bacterium]
MIETKNKKISTIDGVPLSFNTQFIIRARKKCELCNKHIKKEELEENTILYTDEFEFVHKRCLNEKDILYTHLRVHDLSSPVKLMLPTGKVGKNKKSI